MSGAGLCTRCGAEFHGTNRGLCTGCREALAAAPTLKETLSSAPMADVTDRLEAASSFGDYEVLSEIARGGMGVVYKARQKSLNRIVALKMIRSDRLARENDIKRFRTEAQAAAQLQHPNIVAIHEVGDVDGQHFYSMDYVEGRSLSQLARENPLSPEQAAVYVKVIAEAIHYAHQTGVLHRDLKPSNVLIDRNDQPRVADFGLAKMMRLDSELTMSGMIMGTPSYMPPEQATGRVSEVSVRSDVYALGAILYDLLCGRPPFRADTAVETLKQVVELDPVAPRLLNPRVPRDLETICLKCLEKEAMNRYASADAVADELGRFRRGLPIAARPVSRTERMWRWSKQKPASAAALGLLVVIAIGSPMATYFINQARRSAESSRAVAEANLYVAEMNLALEDIEADHRARAIFLLNKHIPRLAAEDRRSFEWQYIWRQARGDYAFKLGFQNDAVRQVLFSRDGRFLASRSIDSTVKLWSTVSRQPIVELTNVVFVGGFSEDGTALMVSTEEGAIGSVDTLSGKMRMIVNNAGSIVRWLPSRNALATTSTNFLLKLLGYPAGNELRVLPGIGGGDPGRGEKWALSVVISGDAAIAASVDKTDPQFENRLVRVWDVASGRNVATSSSTDSPIAALQISPDGGRVAYAADDRLHIWNWREQGSPMVVKAHNTAVRMIAFSNDGNIIATGASDQFIRLWEASTGKLLQVRKGHENSVRALGFSHDGRWLASGGLNEDVRLWDLHRPADADSLPPGSGRALTKDDARELMFSPDSAVLAFVTNTNTAVALDALSLRTIAIRADVVKLPGWASKTGDLLTIGENGAVQKWNPHSNSAADWRPGATGSVAVSADLQLAALARKRGPLRLRDSSDHEILLPMPVELKHLLFSADSRMLAACADNHAVYLWKSRWTTPPTVFAGHSDDVNHLAFSTDGKLLASASSDKLVMLWDVASGRRHATLTGHRHAVYALAFSPDGKLLATGSLDNSVKLWNLSLLQEVGRFNTSLSDEILSENGVFMVAFSPDGNTLAARLRSGGLRLWRAASWDQIRAEALAR